MGNKIKYISLKNRLSQYSNRMRPWCPRKPAPHHSCHQLHQLLNMPWAFWGISHLARLYFHLPLLVFHALPFSLLKHFLFHCFCICIMQKGWKDWSIRRLETCNLTLYWTLGWNHFSSKTSLGAPWWRVKMQVKTHVALPVCFNLAHWTCEHYVFPVKKYVCVLSLSRAQDNDTLPPWSSFESSMGICKRRLTKICHSALVKLFPCV